MPPGGVSTMWRRQSCSEMFEMPVIGPITCKAQFFQAWEQGLLGNRTQLWHDEADAWASGAPEIGFRQIDQPGRGAWEKVPRAAVYETAARWRRLGRAFVMDDGCPDAQRTLSGEVCWTVRGWEGLLGVGQRPMRELVVLGALKPYTGAAVVVLLNTYMDPSSRDDLDALLTMFPDHVVEFSCFGCYVGVFPNRNTIFWECRRY